MRLLQNLVPQTLVGRVSALFLVNLLLFVGAGLGVFNQHQFADNIEQSEESAQVLSAVVAQTVGDSVVIGDYDGQAGCASSTWRFFPPWRSCFPSSFILSW